MPDPKKLAVLEARSFTLREVCLTCFHFSQQAIPKSKYYGWCRDATPAHSKHTDGARVSVRIDGHCPRYEPAGCFTEDAERSGLAQFARKDA